MIFPANEFVASFVGVETILQAAVVERNGGSFIANVLSGRVEAVGDVSVGEEVMLGIRPENVVLALRSSRVSVGALAAVPCLRLRAAIVSFSAVGVLQVLVT